MKYDMVAYRANTQCERRREVPGVPVLCNCSVYGNGNCARKSHTNATALQRAEMSAG